MRSPISIWMMRELSSRHRPLQSGACSALLLHLTTSHSCARLYIDQYKSYNKQLKSWKLNWTGKNSSIIGQSNWDLQKRFEGLTKYLRIGENGCALAVEWQKALECVPRVTLRDTLRLLLLLFLLLLIKHPSWWNARYSVLVFKHKPLNIVQRIFSLDDEDESNRPSFASLLWSGVWPQADILLVNIYSLSDKLDSSTSDPVTYLTFREMAVTKHRSAALGDRCPAPYLEQERDPISVAIQSMANNATRSATKVP